MDLKMDEDKVVAAAQYHPMEVEGEQNPAQVEYKDHQLNQFRNIMQQRAAGRESRSTRRRDEVNDIEVPRQMVPEMGMSKGAPLPSREKRPVPVEGESLIHTKSEAAIVDELFKAGIITEELGHITTGPPHKVHISVNTDIYPYYPAANPFVAKEFWLTAAVIDCANYKATAALLESGAIQHAIHSCAAEQTHEIRMLLMTLIRLAASCHTHAHYLLCVQRDIFDLILACMKTTRTKPSSPDSVVRWNQLSDSRTYNTFLAIAFGAHTRPTGVQYDRMSREEKWLYENHVQIIWATYGSLFQDSATYDTSLPAHLAPYLSTFYLADFAAEIFVDLAPHGFFSTFTASVVEIKWDRCFNLYFENAPFNITTMKLYRLLHQSPRTVAAHLAYPFSIYRHCFSYLSWGLRTILDNEYFRNPSIPESWDRPRTFVPLDFCTSCAETLRAFLDFPAFGNSAAFREVRAFLRQPVVMHQLLQFVLAMPNIVEEKKDPRLDMLYAAIWSLLHSTSYTFPLLFRVLVDSACDETVPDCLGVQAAMYVASAASFARVPLKRSEIVRIYERLLRHLRQSGSEPGLVRRRKQELVFRMAVILCPTYFGIESSQSRAQEAVLAAREISGDNASSNVDDSGAYAASQMFVPYEFQVEAVDVEHAAEEEEDAFMTG